MTNDITAQLAEALKPFAKEAQERQWIGIDVNYSANIGGSSLINADLAKAHAALAAYYAQPRKSLHYGYDGSERDCVCSQCVEIRALKDTPNATES